MLIRLRPPVGAAAVRLGAPTAAGQPQPEGRAVALLRLHGDLAVVVAGHVADDGQAEAGAAGAPAAGPVDPVEALEDPLEVAGGDAHALVDDGQLGPRRVVGPVTGDERRVTIRSGSEYFTALSSRLDTADTSWRRSPITVRPAGPGSTTIVDGAERGGRADAVGRAVEHLAARGPAGAPAPRPPRCG